MTEAEWLTGADPRPMVKHIEKDASPRKARLLGYCCIRHSDWARLVDERSATALEVSERFADGLVTEDEMSVARQAAWDAAEAVQELDDNEMYQPAARVLVAIGSNPRDNLCASQWAGQNGCVCDIFGNPFRAVNFSADWRTDTVVAIARQMYELRDFSATPILADALQDAGCDSDEILNHCRSDGSHARGCWVVDLVLDKE